MLWRIVMENKPKIKWIGIIAVLLLLVAVILILEAETNIIKHTIDDRLYDNYNHYLACNELPTVGVVELALNQHQDTVRQIEEVSPDNVVVSLERYENDCKGKADILINYPSHDSRLAIEKILGGKTFFGIPCRFRNW